MKNQNDNKLRPEKKWIEKNDGRTITSAVCLKIMLKLLALWIPNGNEKSELILTAITHPLPIEC